MTKPNPFDVGSKAEAPAVLWCRAQPTFAQMPGAVGQDAQQKHERLLPIRWTHAEESRFVKAHKVHGHEQRCLIIALHNFSWVDPPSALATSRISGTPCDALTVIGP